MVNNFLTQQEIAFEKECEVIDLSFEYPGYGREERFAIASDLSEEEIWDKYSNIVFDLSPFIHLSKEHGEAFRDFHRTEERLKKSDKRHLDFFGYEEGLTECQCKCFIDEYQDPLYKILKEEERLEINKVLSQLKPIQRERLIKVKAYGMSTREIALEEGVCYSAVDKSVKAAIRNFKKYIKKSK